MRKKEKITGEEREWEGEEHNGEERAMKTNYPHIPGRQSSYSHIRKSNIIPIY